MLIADIDMHERFFKVFTKGKYHQAPFTAELVLPIWQWLTIYRPQTDLPNLLVCQQYRTNNIRVMSRSAVDGVLRRRCLDADLPIFSAHAYRHGFAITTLRAGGSTRLVQKLLGHAHIGTTERYLYLMPELTRELADPIWDKQAPLQSMPTKKGRP